MLMEQREWSWQRELRTSAMRRTLRGSGALKFEQANLDTLISFCISYLNYTFTNLEIVKKIINFFTKKKYISKSYIKVNHVKDRPGHDFKYTLNSDKIKYGKFVQHFLRRDTVDIFKINELFF